MLLSHSPVPDGTQMPDIRVPAIRVDQPLGAFVAFTLSAEELLPLTYSQPAELVQSMDSEGEPAGYGLFGTQRRQKPRRLDDISRFIESTDATFPNAIILAANYQPDGQLVNEDRRWTLERSADGSLKLFIPDGAEQASIIDGQHRLMAFSQLPADARNRDMGLLCVAFLDLPSPFHAFVFATINFNQVKVDRSLAYQLFGFQVDQQPPSEWVPETSAVAIGRLLASSEDSPFFGHITSGLIESDQTIPGTTAHLNREDIKVSMATVVDGILRLVTRNPRRDRDSMRSSRNVGATRSSLKSHNEAPLRPLYIASNDVAIYETVRNYFSAVEETIWTPAGVNSYLKKTVGIQAQFDVLKELLTRTPPSPQTVTLDYFLGVLDRCRTELTQDPNRYQASGIGRTRIRDDILRLIPT